MIWFGHLQKPISRAEAAFFRTYLANLPLKDFDGPRPWGNLRQRHYPPGPQGVSTSPIPRRRPSRFPPTCVPWHKAPAPKPTPAQTEVVQVGAPLVNRCSAKDGRCTINTKPNARILAICLKNQSVSSFWRCC